MGLPKEMSMKINMEIKRERYLKRLISSRNNGLVKVITGLRRCGKSYLLFTLFKNYLSSMSFPLERIIEIKLDNISFSYLRNPLKLSKYILSKIDDEHSYVLLIDEIQFVKKVSNQYVKDDYIGFYDVLNELLGKTNIDIYVTGRNSKMLSKDVLTEFRGRGEEIILFPLSFEEFMTCYDGDKYEGFNQYLMYGGMPLCVLEKDEFKKIDYLKNLLNETYLKDIIEKNNVRNIKELDVLLSIVSSSIGSLTNPYKLSNIFESVKNITISKNSIAHYLMLFEDSFLINEALKYDIKGKKYINAPTKFYFTDIGLRNAKLNFRQIEETHLLENIIFNELIIRGLNVDVGAIEIYEKNNSGKSVLKQLEIDFVANKGYKRYYIQSAHRIDNIDKIKQEKKSFIKH